MTPKDTFQTIAVPSDEILFKEKNSKFFAYAFPVISESEVKIHIDGLRKKHFNAVHFCYAYQIGTDPYQFRTNDDGEPSNSAGIPIYGQIQSFSLTNILIVVVRFFGGTKLGVGGLITAYKTAAALAIEAATIIEKTIDVNFILKFDYQHINKVMRVIKEKKLQIVAQNLDEHCEIEIKTRKSNSPLVKDFFSSLYEVSVNTI